MIILNFIMSRSAYDYLAFYLFRQYHGIWIMSTNYVIEPTLLPKADEFIQEYLYSFDKLITKWKYEDGCVLLGALYLYEATEDKKYADFLMNYMDKFIEEDGTILTYEMEKYNIDNISSGKVLFFLYDVTKKEKYRIAIEHLMDQLRSHPRTKCNNFWHKQIYPNQIWLDGLYMAQPFYMEYETRFHGKENYNDIINQFLNVRKYLYNESKGLYYHGYDESRVQPWANKTTGLSKNFWLRSMGWYLMALVDTMSVMSKEIFEHFKTLEGLLKEAMKGILQYQDNSTNLFYQLIDLPEVQGNYIETSGSAMIGYTILKACRLGYLSKEKYQEIGFDILKGLLEYKLTEVDGKLQLNDHCAVAGLGPGDTRDGSVEYYLSEPIVANDLKGVGAFLMLYAEYLKAN